MMCLHCNVKSLFRWQVVTFPLCYWKGKENAYYSGHGMGLQKTWGTNSDGANTVKYFQKIGLPL